MFIVKKSAIVGILLAAAFLLTASLSLYVAGTVNARQTLFTVVLDAGHGGVDPGVLGVSGERESDINLQIVKKLQSLFSDAGFSVVLTRKNEGGLYGLPTQGYKRRDMEKRREVIVGSKPSVVLSVHQNSFPQQPSRTGGQVFYCAGREADAALAQSIQARLNALSGKSVEALTGDFYVLNCAQAPAVLIECGFLSNAEEEAMLKSDAYQTEVADKIFEGVLGFLC